MNGQTELKIGSKKLDCMSNWYNISQFTIDKQRGLWQSLA